MQVVLDNLGLAVGLDLISELQYIWVLCVCVCNLTGRKKEKNNPKKKKRIKEPPWISINTFTVIKHSSEIQLQSGRQFPLQSYVLLRASMGLGLTLIFLWLVRSGGCYSCKYFCVWGFEPGSSRQAEVHCLITVARHSHRVASPQPQPSCCSLSSGSQSCILGTGNLEVGRTTAAVTATFLQLLHLLFFVPCEINVAKLGAFDIPLCSLFPSLKGLHAAHGLTMPHVVSFLIWFSYCSSFCAILSISSRSLMFTPISNIITVYY